MNTISQMKHTFLITLLLTSRLFAQDAGPSTHILPDESETPRMKKWIDMHYGMFLCYTINNFGPSEHVTSKQDPRRYAPKALDVDSWIRTAKEAGMKYAVFTAKHDGGFCMWDSKVQFRGKECDYDVASSGNTTDVVRAFVDACKKYDIAPGLYYCLADSVNNSTSIKNGKLDFQVGKLPEDYFELVKAQLDELATNYPDCHYYWIDTPKAASVAQQEAIYDLLRRKDPRNVILLNSHLAMVKHATDAMCAASKDALCDTLNTEVRLIPGNPVPRLQRVKGKTYFVGYEHCATMGGKWFSATRSPASADALFGIYQRVRKSGGNLLLNMGLTPEGGVDKRYVATLMQLKEKIEPYERSLAPEKK